MVKDVVVVRLEAVVGVALVIVGLVIEVLGIEHVSFAISVHGHDLISAGQYVPSTHVLVRRLVFIDLVALGLVVAVIVLHRLPECPEQLLVR